MATLIFLWMLEECSKNQSNLVQATLSDVPYIVRGLPVGS